MSYCKLYSLNSDTLVSRDVNIYLLALRCAALPGTPPSVRSAAMQQVFGRRFGRPDALWRS